MLKKETSLDVLEYLVDETMTAFGNYESDEFLQLENLGPIDSQGSLVVLSPEVSEETLDVAARPDAYSGDVSPVSPRGPPSRTMFPGNLDFAVEINSEDTHKKKYLYSHQLNRIYVDIKTDFPVQFRWDFKRAPGPMFVRATTIFSDESQAEKRVERCIQHTHENTNANVNPCIVKNVLHSSRDPYTAGIYYCGEPSLSDCWYSVVVRFEGRAEQAHSHAYQFVCKNSCSTGINRRSIGIIFTLEDHLGNVYGRQSVGARVCACPKRDKLKDEESAAARPGKRRAAPPPPAKRPKLEPAGLLVLPPSRGQTEHGTADAGRIKLESTDVVQLPPLPIVGLKTVITGLEVMLSMMEQVAVAKRHDPQAAELYQGPITSLRCELDKYRELPQEEN